MIKISTRLFNRLKSHDYHVGVYVKHVKKSDTVEVRCFARTHGGSDCLLVKFKKDKR